MALGFRVSVKFYLGYAGFPSVSSSGLGRFLGFCRLMV